MKIAFVLDDTLDTPDGVQQYVLTLGAWMTNQGHEVHYLVGETTRTDIPHVHSLSKNIKVRFNGNRMTIPRPVSVRRIQQLLASEAYDVLHVQMPYSPWLAGRLIKAAPSMTSVIATFHVAPNDALVKIGNRLLGLYTKRLNQRIDQVLSVSDTAQQFARSAYGLHSSILPNVVDVRRFAMALPMKRTVDVPTLMFLGRLVPRKGCKMFLEALTVLRDAHPDVPFTAVICGRGPLEADLKRHVAERKMTDIIRFTGFLQEADKPRYLKSADITVYPSTGGESFGIVLIESMAAGHPVVLGANNQGYSTVLHDHPESLFQTGDVRQLADKLYTYITDTQLRQQTLDWQNQYVAQFDVSAVGTQLLQIYGKPRESTNDKNQLV